MIHVKCTVNDITISGIEHVLGNFELEEVVLTITGSFERNVRNSGACQNVGVIVLIPFTTIKIHGRRVTSVLPGFIKNRGTKITLNSYVFGYYFSIDICRIRYSVNLNS